MLPVPLANPAPPAPRWRGWALYAAAVYNLAWGAFVVLLPALPFRWAGMEPPNYPEIWQCLGMVVGVYGVAYALAARDPLRHWPVVAAGLLGKLLGPLGMVVAVARGTLPPIAGWLCVFNDLIWWPPFALIVLAGWRADRHRHPAEPPR